MPKSFDDKAAEIAHAAHACQTCGVQRHEHAATDHEFKGCDPLNVFDDWNASARSQHGVNHMGATNECLSCGCDARGCMC